MNGDYVCMLIYSNRLVNLEGNRLKMRIFIAVYDKNGKRCKSIKKVVHRFKYVGNIKYKIRS